MSEEIVNSPRPAPAVDGESEAFWAGSLEGRLVLQRCQSCGAVQHFPRRMCTTCHGERLEPLEASGLGTVYSRTVIRQNHVQPFRSMLPYVVALVDLDEGPRLMSNVVDCDPDEVMIGARVRVRFESVSDDAAVPLFELEPH